MGLRWIRVVRRAIQNFKEELTSIYDIFDLADAKDTPSATNILVTGKDCTLRPRLVSSVFCTKIMLSIFQCNLGQIDAKR